MAVTRGTSDVVIGLLDGPVALDHPAFERSNIHALSQIEPGLDRSSAACAHGTFIAGMLCARRNSDAPALCPGCTLLVHPVFGAGDSSGIPAGKLAAAMVEAIDAGARVINLSLAPARPSPLRQCELETALDYAARRNVLVVVAAGNQGALGSSALTRHPWVIPVAACNSHGMPLEISNFGPALGRHGLSAPGDGVISLAPGGGHRSFSGTSVAVPFVSGTIALLWSLFPNASAAHIKHALIHASAPRGATLFPPLLNAARAYRALAATRSGHAVRAAMMR